MLVHHRSLPTNFLARSPQQFTSTHLYTWVERGTVGGKCLAQEHNTAGRTLIWLLAVEDDKQKTGQAREKNEGGLTPTSESLEQARARTRTAQSGDEHTSYMRLPCLPS